MKVERCKCRGECGPSEVDSPCFQSALEGVVPAPDGYCDDCRYKIAHLDSSTATGGS